MRRVLGLVAFLILIVPGAGAAQEPDPPEGAMLIILDASGSMNNVDEAGVPYIDKAKEAILELVDALPDETLVGLRVYGHREPNTDPVRGCQDTQLISPVAPLDRSGIRSAIETIEASGFTPIGLSLQEAVADLPETGPRSIVLISDGEDTCAPPDPCQVAEELFGDHLDVRIESVGFLIDSGSAAEQQLRCIAEVTGGRYTSVDEPNALVARLGEVTDELLDWRPPLTINGALDQAAAPAIPLSPKADWVTDEPGKIAVSNFSGILMPGETRWYQLDLWERESVWVWSDLGWPSDLEAGGVFETLILDPAGNRVEVPVGHGGIPLQVELPGTESPMVGTAIADPRQGWPAQASYLVGFHWDAPPEVFLGSLNIGVEVLNGDVQRYLSRTEIEGAVDPADAPALPLTGSEENGPEWRGGEFRSPLASGETRWYRLDIGNVAELNAFATFPGDRFVGEETEGQFSVALTDTEGDPIGRAFDEWPQMSQTFGSDRHQATVSATTSIGVESTPTSVLLGFRWEGSPGQASEIRFEVEAVMHSHGAEADNQHSDVSDTHPDGGKASDLSSDDHPPITDASDRTAMGDSNSGGFPVVFIVLGVAVIVVSGLVLLRRLRARATKTASAAADSTERLSD